MGAVLRAAACCQCDYFPGRNRCHFWACTVAEKQSAHPNNKYLVIISVRLFFNVLMKTIKI
jgi:hypothetical protein